MLNNFRRSEVIYGAINTYSKWHSSCLLGYCSLFLLFLCTASVSFFSILADYPNCCSLLFSLEDYSKLYPLLFPIAYYPKC